MSGIPRRTFLTGAGAAGLAATAACHSGPKDPYALEKPPVPGAAGWRRHEERWVMSACGQCPAGCGIKVRVVEGRVVKVEGNKEFPVNRGGIGPKGLASPEMLYSPHRVTGPLKRDGAKGSGKFRPVSWEQAVAEIGGALKTVRAAGKPQALLILDGEPRGVMHDAWARFAAAFGTPNHVTHTGSTMGATVAAVQAMEGAQELPAYAWERVRLVVGLGAGLLESWCQTMHLVRSASALRPGLPGRRVKLVTASSRYSSSAMKADEWLPVTPASEGALALGLAHVLVRENLHDAEFVSRHAAGFEPFKDARGAMQRGFKDVLNAYSPEIVAALTGVPAATIERLARDLHENRPSLVVMDDQVGTASNGLATAMAVHALNALLGNVGPNGIMTAAPDVGLSPWPSLVPDDVAKAGLAVARLDGAGTAAAPLAMHRAHALPQAMAQQKTPAVDVAFLFHSNPAFSKPSGVRWQDALEHVGTVVSFSPLMDESALLADYVLPDHTPLERWDLVEPAPAHTHAALTLRQPAVPPLHDTRHSGDVLLQLAAAVGGPVAAAFPWKTYKEAASVRLTGLLHRAGASVEAEDVESLLADMETKGGFWPALDAPPAAAATPAKGAAAKLFKTPSGKFEFSSQHIQERLHHFFPDAAALEAWRETNGVKTLSQDLALPHWEPAHLAGDPAQFHFVLLPYRAINHAEGGVRHLKLLAELPLHTGNPYHEFVEVNPADLEAHNLAEGADVFVESPAGRQRMRVMANKGVRPGSAAVALGHGMWPPVAGAAPTGAWNLVVNQSDPVAGLLAITGTRVKIVRV